MNNVLSETGKICSYWIKSWSETGKICPNWIKSWFETRKLQFPITDLGIFLSARQKFFWVYLRRKMFLIMSGKFRKIFKVSQEKGYSLIQDSTIISTHSYLFAPWCNSTWLTTEEKQKNDQNQGKFFICSRGSYSTFSLTFCGK